MSNSAARNKTTSSCINTEQDSKQHSEKKDTTEVAPSQIDRETKDQHASENLSRPPSSQHQSPYNSSGRWFLPFGQSAVTTPVPSPILPQFRANIPVRTLNHQHQLQHHQPLLYRDLALFSNQLDPYHRHLQQVVPLQRRQLPETTMAPFDNGNDDVCIRDSVPSSRTSSGGEDKDIHHKVSYDDEIQSVKAELQRHSSHDSYPLYYHYYNTSYPSPVYTVPCEYLPPSQPFEDAMAEAKKEEQEDITSTTSTPLTSNQTSSKVAAAKAAVAASNWEHQQRTSFSKNNNYGRDHNRGEPEYYHNADRQYFQKYHLYGFQGSPRYGYFGHWHEHPSHYEPFGHSQKQASKYSQQPFAYYHEGHSDKAHMNRTSSRNYSRGGHFYHTISTESQYQHSTMLDEDGIPVPPTTPYSPLTRRAPPKVTPSTGASIRRKLPNDDTTDDKVDARKVASNVLQSSSCNNQPESITETTKSTSTPLITKSIDSNSSSTLREMDICVGRGAPCNFHQGNEYFRQLISEYQTSYFCAKRSDKPLIAMEVLDVLKERGSRFVRRQKGGGGRSATWVEVNKKLAYEKVCAALREGAPQVQRQFLSSSSLTAVHESQSIDEHEDGFLNVD